MSVKILCYPNGKRTAIAEIVAKYTGFDKLDVSACETFKMGEDNKKPEFLKDFPHGKVPVAHVPEGPLFEAHAIGFYIAAQNKEKGLLGKNLYEEALVNQWVSWIGHELASPLAEWTHQIKGWSPYNKLILNNAKTTTNRCLNVLNDYLANRTFLAADHITLADIELACALFPAFEMIIDTGLRKALFHLARWFDTVAHQDKFIEVLGDVNYVNKAHEPEPPKGQAKKEEKKEKKPAAPQVALPVKKKNPLDELPKTTFDCEEWKRKYSNDNDTRGSAMPWFWEHLDKEGWSIWFCDYNGDCSSKPVFMTSNLVNGFYQRMEHMRKYAMASMIIYGDDGEHTLGGAWIFRGLEMPAATIDCPDYETYDWKKADLTNEKDRKLFDDIFCWDGELGGKKFASGKIFK